MLRIIRSLLTLGRKDENAKDTQKESEAEARKRAEAEMMAILEMYGKPRANAGTENGMYAERETVRRKGNMRILVISDTHGKNLLMKEAVDRAGKVDMVLHLGDIEGGDAYLTSICDCPVIIVRGNNDFFSYQERDRVIDIDNHRVLVTHGHNYGVGFTRTRLAEEAISRNCKIALHGHTHIPVLTKEMDVTIFNPGSLGYPRQASRKSTYGLIEVDRFGELHFTICEL